MIPSDGSGLRARLPGLRFRSVHYPAGLEQPPHSHPHTSITLICRGSLEEWSGRLRETCEPLSVVIKPAGTVHSDRIGPSGASTLQMCVSDRLAAEIAEGASPIECWRWFHGGLPALRFVAILQTLRAALADDASIEAAFFDFIGALKEDGRLKGRGDPPVWLRRVTEEIDETFADGPRVRELARHAGVHPVSLARSFRQYYGTSVTTRLARRRVQRAAGLLAAGRCSLSEVAYRSGFCDQSHLCRVFKTQTGCTPGRFQHLARGT